MGTNTQLTTTRERPSTDELLSIFNITKEESQLYRLDYLIGRLTIIQDSLQILIDKTPQGKMNKYKQQIKDIKLRIEDLRSSRGRFLTLKINSTIERDRMIINMDINQIDEEITTLERRLRYLKSLVKPNKSQTNRPIPIDLDTLKEQIKIKDVLLNHGIKITWNNFFSVRNERTPSCQFNEKKNVFVDYGNANQGGSCLDLYMALNNCSLREAIKSLSILL